MPASKRQGRLFFHFSGSGLRRWLKRAKCTIIRPNFRKGRNLSTEFSPNTGSSKNRGWNTRGFLRSLCPLTAESWGSPPGRKRKRPKHWPQKRRFRSSRDSGFSAKAGYLTAAAGNLNAPDNHKRKGRGLCPTPSHKTQAE